MKKEPQRTVIRLSGSFRFRDRVFSEAEHHLSGSLSPVKEFQLPAVSFLPERNTFGIDLFLDHLKRSELAPFWQGLTMIAPFGHLPLVKADFPQLLPPATDRSSSLDTSCSNTLFSVFFS
ncbi:MAG: hypothetical protein IKD66_02660 [Solobacterium sp.]|nr:hypothetical protein [Solobacterium sp.]